MKQHPWGEDGYLEEVEIESEAELHCDYCGKPADEKDFWQDGVPIWCGSEVCIERSYWAMRMSKSEPSEG